ncbi:ATP-grasp domain-containing protein [Chengkuizengella sp. SCS-71B]|uniref:ATP-grasp domain-containing protein n=1 Tax=Chengkuizengella sp. SCS-71B TaxID=3115290 RepID=UPI0032C20E53
MQKVFMILGGSQAQVDAIKAVKKLEMKALVLDINPNAVGFKYADYIEIVSTTDLPNVERIARKYSISGVMTFASDTAIPTVCYINEKLGLPNQGIGIGPVVTDKSLMKEAFLKHNISSPNFLVLNKEQNIQKILPKLQMMLTSGTFIVKPSDSSGSRGITKIASIEELENAIYIAHRFSKNKKVIIEEFIEGDKIGAQCFSINGKMEMCLINNDTTSNMVAVRHSFPPNLTNEELQRVYSECRKAISSLGITNGPSNLDIMIDKNKKPFIIEVQARCGASMLPELIQYHSGVDLIELCIKLACGQDFTIPKLKNNPVAVEMLYFDKNDHVHYDTDKIRQLIHSYQPLEYDIDLEKGQEVKALKSSANVYGYVICAGSSVHDAEKKCRELLLDIKDRVISKATV